MIKKLNMFCILSFVKYLFILILTLVCLIKLFNIDNNELQNLESEIEYEFDVCVRKCGEWKIANFTNLLSRDYGTCNDLASKRGSNQSVIAFTFYGSTTGGRQYFKGITENVKLLAKYFPGWIIRVYHNVTRSEDVHKLCELYCEHNNVLDICFAGDIPGFGNILGFHPFVWRFLPLSDPQVDHVMCRDLDSRFSAREAAAVTEWLQSGRPLHVMRDHPAHMTAILGGMWGAKIREHRSIWQESFAKILQSLQNKNAYNDDQLALTREVFKLADLPGWLITHDSFFCRFEPFMKGEIRSFPTQRVMNEKLNFVGSQTFGIDYLKQECPLQCRKHPEWNFC